MKYFLEMKEQLTDEEVEDGIQPVYIRVEVNGKADAVSRKPNFMQYFAGRTHRDTVHTCNHPNGKCEEEVI